MLLSKTINIYKNSDKMKNKKYNNVGTVSKSNRNIVERGKFDTLSTYIYMIDDLPGLEQSLQ